MLSLAENLLMVLLVVGLSVLLFVVMDRVWAWDKRHQHNDVTGWQLGILGTTYAVILGFMLYAVWTDFDTATQNVELEANGLVNMYRLADGLPQATRDEVQKLARSYASAAIEKDWPAMERGELPNDTGEMSWKLSKAGRRISRRITRLRKWTRFRIIGGRDCWRAPRRCPRCCGLCSWWAGF
jgi:hypothetical protein